MNNYSRIAALLTVAATATHALARPVTIDDLMALKTIVDVKISPDGRRVAYVVSTPSVARNQHESEVYIVAAAGGQPMRVARDARIFTPTLPAPRLRWTPAGDAIAFLAVVDNRPQVYSVAASGGQGRALTTAPEGVIAFEFAPDGKSLAYLSRDAAPPVAVTRVDAPGPPVRLWLQPIGGWARAVTPDGEYVDSLSWSPDSSELVYSSAPVTGFLAPYATRLFRISARGGDPRLLVDRPGMNTTPKFSPDGQSVAFITTNGRRELMAPRGLAVVSTRGGSADIRSHPMDGAWIGEMVWAPDSQSIYVLMNEGTFATGAQMFEMPVVRLAIDSGRAERVVDGAIVNYSISVSRDGRWLAYREVGPRDVGDVVVREVASGRTQKLTNVNPQLSELDLGTLDVISWTSFDGTQIWGMLITPKGYARDRRIPLIVYCHGGPIGGVTYGIFPQFMHVPGQIDPYPVEALVSAGYAVLFPMPRGGSGYGEAGHRSIINAWGEADYKDIMAGVDHVVARGIADPNRLGVMGASYGGYMTNWIVTQTDRFKAASSSASISDIGDLFYLTDAGDVVVEYFKRPWENRESYAAHSPITHVEQVKTPLLLQHGENDPRVPLASGRRFYQALKALGRTVEFDIFPRGGHVQYPPVYQRESMRRNLEWFQRWIR